MARSRSQIPRRLSTFRPAIDRAVFALALLGILTSFHLKIQQDRGFDQGCFGFSTSEKVEASFNCAVVTESDASSLFGVSNTIWGLIFYLAVAALTVAVAFNWKNRLLQFKKARALLILAGFLYSLYLVYFQFFGIGELCALCLTSAGISTALFALQAVDFFTFPSSKQRQDSIMSLKPIREVSVMGAAVLLVAVLVGADFAYFDRLEPAVAVEEPTSAQAVSAEGVPSGECMYDPEHPVVEDYTALINFFDPSRGNAEAEVTVIEYFDPNCPHCKTIHPIMKEVIQTHGDKARFVFKPFVLWSHSVAQSEALYAAAQEGKFFEMLDLQYAIQQPQTGLSEEQLRAIASEIGMNPDVLIKRIESGLYRRTLAETKDKGVKAGVNSTPAVLINGRFVESDSRNVDCLRKLIDGAAQS
jgi:protein-disulfide isomerase/uncharacterized membrane protein